jgi:hypothetical protein
MGDWAEWAAKAKGGGALENQSGREKWKRKGNKGWAVGKRAECGLGCLRKLEKVSQFLFSRFNFETKVWIQIKYIFKFKQSLSHL